MKTLYTHLMAFVLASTSVLVWARGGSLVGNGAGLMENRFQYAYITLHKVLLNCVLNEDCDMGQAELALAGKVADVMALNMNNPKKFVFMTEKEMEAVISTGSISEPHRIAMTGLTPDIPIYVNVDQLYNSKGQPQLDYSVVIGIIFHEVGHQAGEKNHQLLDMIGSKLRVKAEAESHLYRFEPRENERVEISILNFSYPNKFAELRLTRNNESLTNVSPLITRQLKCSKSGMSVSGYEFFNGFFSPEFDTARATFNFIANVFCISKTSAKPMLERLNIKFDISAENQIQNWQLKRLK